MFVATEKAFFEAWECQIAEMVVLGTAFPPTLTREDFKPILS